MAHDVFISHSARDKPYADAVCAKLESRGIRCWIAPRDIEPGMDWGAALIEAIDGARVMLLVFSSHANDSPQIKREVERAVNKEIIVVPVRVEDVKPTGNLEYFLGTPHWLDAITTPFDRHLDRIADSAKFWLQRIEGDLVQTPEPPMAPASRPVISPDEPRAAAFEIPVARPSMPATSPDQPPAPAPIARPRSRPKWIVPTIAGLAIALIAAAAYFGTRYFIAQDELARERIAQQAAAEQQQRDLEAEQQREKQEEQDRERAEVAAQDEPAAESTAAPEQQQQNQAGQHPEGAAEAPNPAPTPGGPGWIGVDIKRVTPDLAQSQGLPRPEGALVASTNKEGPASKAGLERGDIVLSFNGHPVDKPRDLPPLVAETSINQTVPIEIVRNREHLTLEVTLGDRGAAMGELQAAAGRGDAVAEFNLGRAYQNGSLGLPKDPNEALNWFHKSAAQDNAAAEIALGVAYGKGLGVPKDEDEAARWYRKAADLGSAPAEAALGARYSIGLGVPKDYHEAMQWSRKAADQGNADGESSLGLLYRNGYGVPRDYDQAILWDRKAADQGNPLGENYLGGIYRDGAGVPRDYNAALGWFRKAADQGNTFAQSSIGEMYRDGKGVPKDNEEAVRWFRKAADQRNQFAEANLGFMYERGWGVPRDLAAAENWYQRAAAQGNEFAKKKLQELQRAG